MVFTRLLPILLLLTFSSLALSQDGKTQSVPETCAVTNPLEHPFVPPKPYQTNRGINWFGTDKLWTYLPSNGISGQGEKTLWFREEWSHYSHWIPDESALKLTITARRLDAATPPPEISAGPTFTPDWKAFMLGGINLPTPGCWEITGRYEDAEVQFVEWVLPDAPAKQTQDQVAPLSIIVDNSCLIEPQSDPLVLGDRVDARRDDAICHLESVLSSHHIEEKITDGRIAPGLRKALEEKNPKNEKGWRPAKNHQWLTADIGDPMLAQHLYSLVMFQRLALSSGYGWNRFVKMVDRVHPRKGATLELPFPDGDSEL